MLRGQSIENAFFTNVFIAAIWHCASFLICVYIDADFFDAEKRMYRPHKWEKDGRFYRDVLKINLWKDLLPQYTGKDGFSKDHIDNTSVEYIDQFILETCRGEWNHTINCCLTFVLLAINEPSMGIILSLCVNAGNLPFVIIQRYNRFRLQKLRRILVKKAGSHNRNNQTAAASSAAVPKENSK